jgi:hypothetical protein
LAAKAGASVKLVQTQLGHSDPALTLRLYQHLFPDDLDALAMRMDEVFRTGCPITSKDNQQRSLAAWPRPEGCRAG